MTPWDYAALVLREKAAEAEWRSQVSNHASQDIAGRLYAWRRLEGVRAEVAQWMARHAEG